MHLGIQSIPIEFKSCEMFVVSDFVDMFLLSLLLMLLLLRLLQNAYGTAFLHFIHIKQTKFALKTKSNA